MEQATGLKTSDYYFDLPQELIAQDPLEDRAASRLLVMNRQTGEIEHRVFRDIKEYLRPGDTLVLNDTKVIPARLLGTKEETGANVEILLLKRLSADRWETLVRPGKKLRPGARVSFGGGILKYLLAEGSSRRRSWTYWTRGTGSLNLNTRGSLKRFWTNSVKCRFRLISPIN